MFDLDELDEQEDKAFGRWTPWEPLVDDDFARHLRWGRHPETPSTVAQFKLVCDVVEPGEFWGLPFPFTPQMLQDMGPAWLTEAMQTYGSLPKDNSVTKFVDMDVKGEDVNQPGSPESNNWGGACIKVLLDVEYENDKGEPPRKFFIKMPHPYNGKNERYRSSVAQAPGDWGEVMWYNTLAGRLPIRTPKGYFADMNRKTTNFCIISEMVPMGRDARKKRADYQPNEIFFPPGKYRDWAIEGAADMYYAHSRMMAQWMAWHKRVGEIWGQDGLDQIRRFFMSPDSFEWRQSFLKTMGEIKGTAQRDLQFRQWCDDPGMQGLVLGQGFSSQIADGFLEMMVQHVSETPHIYPPDLVTEEFQAQLVKEAKEMKDYVSEMNFYSSVIPEYETIVHPNAQLDNAYYWKDESGQVQAGLLDMGGISVGNAPNCMANGWIGAESEMMDEHEEGLVKAFLEEYERHGGPKLDFDEFHLHVKLAHGAVFFGCMANIGMLKRTIKKDEWAGIKDRKDTKIDNLFLARCYMVQVELYLGMWRKRSPYKAFQKWIRRTKLRPKLQN